MARDDHRGNADSSDETGVLPQENVYALLNATGQGIYGVDLNGDCTFANPACVELLGYESAQVLLGRNMHNLIHHTRTDGSPYPAEECHIYQAFREAKGIHLDNEVVWRADGTRIPVEYWSHPVFLHGELSGCVVAFVDIRDRVQAEQGQRESEEKVRALLNATGEGIYGVDLEGNCTFANPFCVELLGYESDTQLLGRNMHELIHHTLPNGEPYAVEECRIYQAFREGQGMHISDELVWRSDGTCIPVEYWSYPMFVHGELSGCVVAFVDISERKRAEEELRQTEKLTALGKLSAGLAHELNNPAAAAGRAAAQIREHMEALGKLTFRLSQKGLSASQWRALLEAQASVSPDEPEPRLSALERADREDTIAIWLEEHGIQTAWELAPDLLATGVDEQKLQALATGLPRELLPDALHWLSESHAIKELADTISASTGSISSLVGAVKDYSYMDQAPEREIDLHEGIESTLRILAYRMKDGPRLLREFDTGLPRLVLRAGELNQVWTNLIENAIDAAGPAGEIRIRTHREGDFAQVEIADNGPGIPAEFQSRIFDPFFTTKEVGQGTGLGLDIARRIVTERCGGRIDFTSRPGDTRFRVDLPLGARQSGDTRQ